MVGSRISICRLILTGVYGWMLRRCPNQKQRGKGCVSFSSNLILMNGLQLHIFFFEVKLHIYMAVEFTPEIRGHQYQAVSEKKGVPKKLPARPRPRFSAIGWRPGAPPRASSVLLSKSDAETPGGEQVSALRLLLGSSLSGRLPTSRAAVISPFPLSPGLLDPGRPPHPPDPHRPRLPRVRAA